jgi:hypothetical protein
LSNAHVVDVAWYRFRATYRRNLTSYLAVVLLIGLVGGVAMASIAAARRTQSSYPTFMASTNPSDVSMATYNATDGGGFGPDLTKKIEALPGVTSVRTGFTPPIVPLTPSGAPRLSTLGFVETAGSVDGLFDQQDRLAITQGHAANPKRADEVVMTATAARDFGVHVGDVVPFGLYKPAQQNEAGFGTPAVKPALLLRLKLVGIAVLNTQVVQDGVDQVYGFVFITPALIKQIIAIVPGHPPALYDVQFKNGESTIARDEHELASVVPAGITTQFHVTSQVVSTTELAIKPESVALGAFGIIAALACLVLAAQSIARLFQRGEEERRVVRSLGASPGAIVADGMLGVGTAVVLGTIIAAVVAAALSPLAPIGPVRPVYPDRGISLDWTVLGVGCAVLIAALGAAALAQSVRAAPHRHGTRRSGVRPSSVVRVLRTAGMSVAGVVGVHFAIEPGRGRTAVPVRSVLVGTVFAVALVVTTLTFASGLSTLVSHPALYGWNFSYSINPTNDVPPGAVTLLNHDPDVAAWSGYDYTDLQINGQTFPVLMTGNREKVFPPLLAGHEVDGDDQIVLGAATMAELHKRIGDTVSLSYATPDDAPVFIPPTKLTIVGTATLPAIGYSTFVAEHTSMGTGAVISLGAIPKVMLAAIASPDPNLNGPDEAFVRLKPGIGAGAGKANLESIAKAANKIFAADKNATGNNVSVLDVVRPVQIVNYRTIGSTPVILAFGLALGAIVALGLTLASSVRRRRRDLALLKTFGFTQRQLSATVAWQATVDAVVGIVLGIPIGIVVGRELWTLFARNINAVPDATVPLVSVLLVGVGTLVFTNLVAVLPGLSAARTSTALVLRAE